MRIVCSLASLVVLAGCAHGPVVTHVTNSNTEWANQNHQVFYALPRTLVQVAVPVKTRTLQCGLLHWLGYAGGESTPTGFPGKCPDTEPPIPSKMSTAQRNIGLLRLNDDRVLVAGARCRIENSLDPEHECALSFTHKTLKAGNELFACQAKGAWQSLQTNVVLAGDPTASVFTVPDPEHIYAISLKPGLFEKLKLDMELAANGAPAKLSSVSSSVLVETAQTWLGVRVGTKAVAAISDGGKNLAVSAKKDGKPSSDPVAEAIAAVVQRMLKLEKERRKLLGTANGQAAAAALTTEQARLRTLIEGTTKDKEDPLRLTFDPPSPSIDKTSTVFQSAVRVDIHGFHPCGESTDATASSVVAWLHLKPDWHSNTWVARQSPSSEGSGEQGFRYRVPRQAAAAIELRRTCSPGCETWLGSDNIEKAPPVWGKGQYEIARSLPINQWGAVRSLPRRVGWGAGSVSASLDPQTGALKLIGTDGAGAMQQPFIAAVAEAGKDHELSALQREKTELELRLSICKSRQSLGLPLPAECPVAE